MMNDDINDEGPTVLSLDEVQVHVAQQVHEYLSESLLSFYDNDAAAARGHMNRILQAYKTAPSTTTCRVNLIQSTPKQVQEGLKQHVAMWKQRHDDESLSSASDDDDDDDAIDVYIHPNLNDVVCIGPRNPSSKSLAPCRVPPPKCAPSNDATLSFKSWPLRAENGWPMTHRVVVCDRFCGEAVLRGSDIFVRGVICADSGIKENEKVGVYTDIRGAGEKRLPRGLMLTNYKGTCIFLGMGITRCDRGEMFTAVRGVAVEMSCRQAERAGPALPPLSGGMPGKFIMQNLPSIVVAHALDPQAGEVIIDLCSAPGGKTSHVASLVRNNAIIVACDESRTKMVAARKQFEELGATCIIPLAWDSTLCVVRDGSDFRSVQEILSSAQESTKYGLKNVKAFYPESFDRVLLDPPCSALGLRPKLVVNSTTKTELEKLVKYQQQFVREAVSLVKPGGTMTYSTCTIHAAENEGIVRFILTEFSVMQLVNVGIELGQPGLPGVGLSESERHFVRRFDPSDREADSMGFFVAKFVKRNQSEKRKCDQVA